MKLKVIISFLLLIFMTCCNKSNNDKANEEKKEVRNHINLINKNKSTDNSFEINMKKDSLFRDDKICLIIDKKNEEDNLFLSDFIFYFRATTININNLNKEKYYQGILQKTNVFELPEYYFKKEYHTFLLKNVFIKDYGKCYIAEYFFNDALGYMQTKFYVIVNVDKSEISIWNFDNLNVTKKGLECDFNVRGKKTMYNFFYLKKCKKFILI